MVILQAGEQIIKEEPVTMVRNGQTHSGGKLILTNARVIYEAIQKGGLFSAGSTTTVLDEPLDEVQNVSESKPLIKIPFVSKNILMVEFPECRVDFAVKDPTTWTGSVIQTKQALEHGLETIRSYDEAKDFQKELMLQRAGASNISIGETGGETPHGGGSNTKACIMCGGDMPARARFCPHCKESQE